MATTTVTDDKCPASWAISRMRVDTTVRFLAKPPPASGGVAVALTAKQRDGTVVTYLPPQVIVRPAAHGRGGE